MFYGDNILLKRRNSNEKKKNIVNFSINSTYRKHQYYQSKWIWSRSSFPFGKVKVKEFYYLKEYEENEQDRNNDIGILVLDIPLGAKTGILGLTNSIDNFNYKNGTIIGYPV